MTGRQIEEVVARCVATVVFYRAGDPSGHARDAMTSELRAMALSLGDAGLSAAECRDRVVDPARIELVARFGPERGEVLGRDLSDAFAGDDPAEATFAVDRPGRPLAAATSAAYERAWPSTPPAFS